MRVFRVLFPMGMETPYPPKIAKTTSPRGSQGLTGALWREQISIDRHAKGGILIMIKPILIASAIILAFGLAMPFLVR